MTLRLFTILLFFLCTGMPVQSTELWQLLSIVTEKEKPDELAYAVFVELACPINEKEVSDIVEDVLVRNRIKPLGEFSYVGEEVYLDVIVYCAYMRSTDTYAVNIQVRFAADLPPDTPVIYRNPYSRVGIAVADNIESGTKALTEAAIADYRQINFDACEPARKGDESPVHVCQLNSLLGFQRALTEVAN